MIYSLLVPFYSLKKLLKSMKTFSTISFTFFPCTYISSTFYLCSFNIVSIILHCSYSTISLYNLTLIRQTTVTSLNVPKIAVKTKTKDNNNIKIKWRRKNYSHEIKECLIKKRLNWNRNGINRKDFYGFYKCDTQIISSWKRKL